MEVEGFICPYCLVSFSAPAKLQAHFIEMHSASEACGDVGAAMGYEALGEEEVSRLPVERSHSAMPDR